MKLSGILMVVIILCQIIIFFTVYNIIIACLCYIKIMTCDCNITELYKGMHSAPIKLLKHIFYT